MFKNNKFTYLLVSISDQIVDLKTNLSFCSYSAALILSFRTILYHQSSIESAQLLNEEHILITKFK
jgi:hypothetical protein